MYTKVRNLLTLLAIAFSPEFFAQTTHTWGPAGPILTAGRARNMIVDKNNSNLLYVGSSSGGIFKSVDGGANWAPVNDQDSVRNISYMAQAADGTIYAATGEGFLRYGQKAKAQAGTGLYKLVGSQLVRVAHDSVTGNVINRIACHPTDPLKIALATNKGIMIAVDGSNFSLAPITPTNAQVTDVSYGMEVKFDNAGNLFCTVGNERGSTTPNYAAVYTDVYRSTDGNYNVFDSITPTSPTIGTPNYGRIELAISPSNPKVIYASCSNKNISTPLNSSPSSANLKALFVTTDGGDSWQLVLQGASQLDYLTNGGSIATGDYAHTLLVHPTNPHMLFIGGYKFFIYSATATNPANGTMLQVGSPFTLNSPYYLHENIHDIRIIQGTPAKFFFITDAGIYRSTDLLSTDQFNLPSFQPYFKGLITGQFNSVSIESNPIIDMKDEGPGPGDTIKPHFGYIGGTGGNGLVYFSGTSSLVSQESNYIGGEIYNAELSKILTDAAFFTTGTGSMYRITNVKDAQPSALQVSIYSGSLSALTSTAVNISNANAPASGTAFKLWEYYGQVPVSPDSAMFYNDSVRVMTSLSGGVPALQSTKSFTFSGSLKRPNNFAALDSIVIRTGTLEIAQTPAKIPTAYNAADKKQITIKLLNNNVPTTTVTAPLPGGGSTVHTIQIYKDSDIEVTGSVDSASMPQVIVNLSTQFDEIVVTFSAPPFANKTATYNNIPDPALYYKVFATVFYKYKVGDTIVITDQSISTKTEEYTVVLDRPLNWAYGSAAARALVGNLLPFPKNNSPVMTPVARSARLAMCLNSGGATGSQNAVVVAKSPLNLNEPLSFIRVSQTGTWTDDSIGNPTNTRIFYSGRPVMVEWSKSGTELYFATHDNKLYRVSHITRLMDFSARSEGGKFNTDLMGYGTSAIIPSGLPNPRTPYRTTQIGDFGTKTITSISVTNDDTTVIVTLNGAVTNTIWPGTVYMTNFNARQQKLIGNFPTGWDDKSNGFSGLAGKRTYCSLVEMNNDGEVFIGTDDGLVYTDNINAATVTWNSTSGDAPIVGNAALPRVQVFDIDQQTLMPDAAYNSGEILVATNGRGVWSNRGFINYSYVGVEELEKEESIAHNVLKMFPNPANGLVSLSFNAISGERASLHILDLNGRAVMNEDLGRLGNGEYNHIFDAGNLNSGVYIVNVTSNSGVQRISKLVIAR